MAPQRTNRQERDALYMLQGLIMHLCTRLYQSAITAHGSIAALGAIWAALFLLAGCSTVGISPQSPFAPSSPVKLHVGDVVETATGNVISMDQLVAKLSKVSVVYVGETHTSTEDHKVQLAILKKLSRGGRCVQLAMEMFPANAQPVLDRYIHGHMSEESFLKEVKWNEVWGFPYSLYRGLIDWQKQRHMRVIGLNAPHGVVRKIAHEGLGSLTPAERSQVAREFHLDDPANRERVRKEYMMHEKYGIKDFQSFLEAQLAWEETMAQTLAQHLEHTNCIILVTLGKGHINKRHGVPYLTNLRKPNTYRTVVPVPIDYPFSTLDPNLADYVVITDKSEAFRRPRLGVIIQPTASGRGVKILGILPGFPAAKAHFRKGDIIISVNGSPVKSVEEAQQALAHGGPDYKILVERDNVLITINVTIGP